MYRAFTRMRDKSCRRRLRSLLLYLCDVFRALINSLESLFFNVVEKNAFLRSRVPLKCIYIYTQNCNSHEEPTPFRQLEVLFVLMHQCVSPTTLY